MILSGVPNLTTILQELSVGNPDAPLDTFRFRAHSAGGWSHAWAVAQTMRTFRRTLRVLDLAVTFASPNTDWATIIDTVADLCCDGVLHDATLHIQGPTNQARLSEISDRVNHLGSLYRLVLDVQHLQTGTIISDCRHRYTSFWKWKNSGLKDEGPCHRMTPDCLLTLGNLATSRSAQSRWTDLSIFNGDVSPEVKTSLARVAILPGCLLRVRPVSGTSPEQLARTLLHM
jgi:hypothetical protein